MAIQFGIIAVLFLSVYAFTNPQVDFTRNTETGIQFQNEKWITALQRAKKENKLIFLDVYAVWCGPCKRLKKNTFSNAEVGQVFNHKFINLAMDGEKGEGPDLMEQYRLTSFPSLLFIDGDGKVVFQTNGYVTAKELLLLGNTILTKL